MSTSTDTTSTTSSSHRRRTIARRRGDTPRRSEALRAAIVEANYLNQISSRHPRAVINLTDGTTGSVTIK